MKLDSQLLCPTCAEVLLVVERASVEIDVCPKCRGVWLDRGELDKLLSHASLLDKRDFDSPKYRDDDDDDEWRARRSDRDRSQRKGRWDFLKEMLD